MQEFSHEYAYHWFHFPTTLEKTAGLWPIRSGRNKAKSHFKVGPRVITYFSVHFVLKGEGMIIQGETKKHLKEGDLFCLFPNQTHQYTTDPNNPLELFWLAFDGKQATPLLNRIGLSQHSFIIDSLINNDIISVLDELSHHFTNNIKDDELNRLSIIYKLFYHISLQTKERNLTPVTTINWIQESKKYMDMHFADDITVKDVAKYAGIHRSHFTTSFVKEVGITPLQYLLTLKMNRASQMISEHSYTITEIAYSLGYSDLYSFSRAFKNYYKVSPKQYLKSNKEHHVN